MHFNEAVTKWNTETGNSVEWATRINQEGVSEKSEEEMKKYIIEMIIISQIINTYLAKTKNEPNFQKFRLVNWYLTLDLVIKNVLTNLST